MQPFKFTTIAHSDRAFCNPLSDSKADRLLELLELRARNRVLDVGCGKGEMLLRLVRQFAVEAVGVDISPPFLTEAATRAAAAGLPPDNPLFHLESARDFAARHTGYFDAALCVGSTHALGNWPECLASMASQVRSGGRLLLGHGYWKRTPHPDYLEGLGAAADDYTDHAGNVNAGEALGLIPLYSTTSSDDEWDDYEGQYCLAVERYVRDHPDDPDAAAMTQRIRTWRRLYHRWGRETLGFGFYLFQKP